MDFNEGVQPIENPDEPAPRMFPVRLKFGYFPKWKKHPKNPASGDPVKVRRGEVIELPIEEAREMIEKGIGERADQLPI